MLIEWTKGLDKDAKEEIKKHFASSLYLRKRMADLVRSKIETTNKNQLLKDGYDCPNWTYKQADNVGYNRALHEILGLLEK